MSNGLVLHGTYSKKSPYNTCTPEGVDECVSWGDYFYMEALVRLLALLGVSATQATISRDIKELSLEKRQAGKKSVYYYPENRVVDQNKYLSVFSNGFSGIEAAGTIVVIKTVSGMAMAAAAALDNLDIRQIVGTIAGDDTIMCATRSEQDAKDMVEHINSLLSIF